MTEAQYNLKNLLVFKLFCAAQLEDFYRLAQRKIARKFYTRHTVEHIV